MVSHCDPIVIHLPGTIFWVFGEPRGLSRTIDKLHVGTGIALVPYTWPFLEHSSFNLQISPGSLAEKAGHKIGIVFMS